MPRASAENDFDALCAIIAPHPQGLGVDGLLRVLNGALTRRTLQRRLGMLTRQGRLLSTGAGRATRYRVAAMHASAGAPAPSTPADDVQIPLSAEGAEICARVRQPRQARRPVGYRMEFPDAYQPNVSAYLPAALREQLHALGRSPAADVPAGTFVRDIRTGGWQTPALPVRTTLPTSAKRKRRCSS